MAVDAKWMQDWQPGTTMDAGMAVKAAGSQAVLDELVADGWVTEAETILANSLVTTYHRDR